MANKLSWILFALAAVATLSLCVLWLDLAITLDDARSETKRIRERSELALSVIQSDWVGREAAKVTALSDRFEKQGVITGTEDGAVEIGDLIFEVREGVVTGVRYF